LKKKNFKLKVDQKKVEISYFTTAVDQDVDVLFLLDLSGSMALGRKLESVKKVILFLVDNLHSTDRWQLVVFADKQVLKVLDDTHGRDLAGVLGKARAYGKTALYDALLKAPDYFEGRSSRQRVVFLFTDGHDNNSILSFEETRYFMKSLNVPLFAIGIMDGFLPSMRESEDPLNIGTLKALATAGGGELLIARDYADLLNMKEVLRDNLRAHYLLGFMVERGAGEKRHYIKVTTQKKLHIRHRNSYIGLPP
jgi:Mg-chelatase subunit ChlD